MKEFNHQPLLVQLLICSVFLWIVVFGCSKILQRDKEFLKWSDKQRKLAWTKHKKFIIGFAIGALLMSA